MGAVDYEGRKERLIVGASKSQRTGNGLSRKRQKSTEATAGCLVAGNSFFLPKPIGASASKGSPATATLSHE